MNAAAPCVGAVKPDRAAGHVDRTRVIDAAAVSAGFVGFDQAALQVQGAGVVNAATVSGVPAAPDCAGSFTVPGVDDYQRSVVPDHIAVGCRVRHGAVQREAVQIQGDGLTPGNHDRRVAGIGRKALLERDDRAVLRGVDSQLQHAPGSDFSVPGKQRAARERAHVRHGARIDQSRIRLERLCCRDGPTIGRSGDADGLTRGVRPAEGDGHVGTLLAAADAVTAAGADDAAVDGDRAARFVPLAAADSRAGAADGGDRAAADDDRTGSTVTAAADARTLALVHFGRGDGAAVNRDGAAVAVVAAADACAVAAVKRKRAAVDGDGAAVAAVAAADACAVLIGIFVGGDGTAPDDDGAAVAAVTAADARAVLAATVGGDVAAVDGDGAAAAVPAAADARAVAAARGRDVAAIDRDGAAGLAVVAADARAVVIARSLDGAAVDHDIAVVMPGVAADGRAAGGMRIDLAGILTIALGIDRQRTALGYVQALHIQGVTVAQDQVDVTSDGFHAAVLGDVAVQIIPAAGHIAVGRHRLGGMGLIGGHDLRAVPAALHIGHRAVREGGSSKQPQRRNRAEQQHQSAPAQPFRHVHFLL